MSDIMLNGRRLGQVIWFYMCMLASMLIDGLITSKDFSFFIERFISISPIYTIYSTFIVISWQLTHSQFLVKYQRHLVIAIPVLTSFFVVFIMTMTTTVEGIGRALFLLCNTYIFYYFIYLRHMAVMPIRNEVLLSSLQQKLKPHFLFNAINTVLGVVRDEPRMAERLLEDLSELFRNLAIDDRVVYTFKEDLDITLRYLDIENIRTGGHIDVQLDIDESTLLINVPFLLLQPLVENAVHYGSVDTRKNGYLRLASKKTSNGILVILENNVNEQEDLRKGAGTTLNNLTKRLSLMYDVDASIDANTTKGLFRVQIRFPDSPTCDNTDVFSKI